MKFNFATELSDLDTTAGIQISSIVSSYFLRGTFLIYVIFNYAY